MEMNAVEWVLCSAGWSFLTDSDVLLTALEQSKNGQKEEDLLTEVQTCINHREDGYALASDSKIHTFGWLHAVG